MDKKDLLSLFLNLKNKYDDADVQHIFDNYDITKLDINRVYRYIDKYITENAESIKDQEIEEYTEELFCEP